MRGNELKISTRLMKLRDELAAVTNRFNNIYIIIYIQLNFVFFLTDMQMPT